MHVLLSIIGILVFCRALLAQTDSSPQFEVASIIRSAPDSQAFMKAYAGGRLDVSHQTLRTLIALAYRVQSFRILGGPPWVRSEYFDVKTKSTGNPDTDRLLLTLQTLLSERFALRIHAHNKVMPVYALRVGKVGKRAPTGLQVTTEGTCVKLDPGTPSNPRACGGIGIGQNHLEAQEISMASLAEALSRVLDREVIDKTGRAEKFNVSLQWAPDDREAWASNDTIAVPSDTPSIFVAIREQLGLRLKPESAPSRILVIDHAEPPSAN